MNEPSSSAARDRIGQLLNAIRRRIRQYVCMWGLCVAGIWLIAAFWMCIALDYFPAMLGMSELTRGPRLVLLGITLSGLIWIVLRRMAFPLRKPLRPANLALLVERRFPHLQDSIITVITAKMEPEASDTTRAQLMRATRQRAVDGIASVRVGELFNYRPLLKAALLCAVMVAITLASLVAFPTLRTIGPARLFALADVRWPRRCQIEIVGLRVRHENPLQGIAEIGQVREFEKGTVTVVRGCDATLSVQALSSSGTRLLAIPDRCTLWYRSGQREGRVVLKRIGQPRDGVQQYLLDGEPLNQMTSDIELYVQGGDDRIGPLHIQVVDEPVVLSTSLDCRFPDYLIDGDRWTPRTYDQWARGMELPQGTSVVAHLAANKPIHSFYVRDPSAEHNSFQPHTPLDDMTCELKIDRLDEDWSREIVLVDSDGLISNHPMRLDIGMSVDRPPHIEVSLRGIGSAVTPNVQIPLTGTLTDDHGVASVWIECEIGGNVLRHELPLGEQSQVAYQIDFLEKQRRGLSEWKLVPGTDAKLRLTLKAQDRCNLQAGGHVGQSETFEFDVVAPDQMLTLLDQTEVGLRRRLEQVHTELSAARDYITRTRDAQDANSPSPSELDEQNPPQTNRQQRNETRLLYAQRTATQTQKSTQELIGIADQFDDLRLQLINNRIDSEDRKTRLSNLVIAPLRKLTAAAGEGTDSPPPPGSMSRLRQDVQGAGGDLTASIDGGNRRRERKQQRNGSANRLGNDACCFG